MSSPQICITESGVYRLNPVALDADAFYEQLSRRVAVKHASFPLWAKGPAPFGPCYVRLAYSPGVSRVAFAATTVPSLSFMAPDVIPFSSGGIITPRFGVAPSAASMVPMRFPFSAATAFGAGARLMVMYSAYPKMFLAVYHPDHGLRKLPISNQYSDGWMCSPVPSDAAEMPVDAAFRNVVDAFEASGFNHDLPGNCAEAPSVFRYRPEDDGSLTQISAECTLGALPGCSPAGTDGFLDEALDFFLWTPRGES
jgi:hypothetical protein